MNAVTWDDEAQCELNCSALYLRKRGGIDLGERFLRHVEAAVASARAMPELHRKISGGARRVRVERFPYQAIYWHDEAGGSIQIIAIAHSSREPGYWRDRLPRE